MNFYYWLSSTLSFGYTCLMPLLITAWIIFKKHRERIMPFIAIANGWFCVYSILLLSYLAIELFNAWYDQYRYEGYGFYYSKMNIFSLFGFVYWLRFVTIPLSLLSLWKRFRRKIWLSTIILLILVISNERLIIHISRFYSDYLPSSWSVGSKNWWEHDLFHLLCYLLIIAATYYWQQKRKLSTRS